MMKSTASFTPKMEDYLRHLYRLEQETDSRVSNSAIAGRLGVTPPTVSSMLETLSDRGLIERERYRPVRLTTEGKELALGVIRRHRLVETMLSELFDYTISEIDTEADILEHHLSPRLCGEIEQLLDMPEIDPHGDPIPDTNLNIPPTKDATSLNEVSESSCVKVTRILTQDDETLDYLISTGIEPSVRFRLEEKTPIGMVTITFSDTEQQTSLPQGIASQILVSPVDDF